MEFFYFLTIASVIFGQIVALKHEQISDCKFENIGQIPGDDKVTFKCAESNSNSDSSFFLNATLFKCSNTNVPQKNLWPGTINFENCRFREITNIFFDSFVSLHTFTASDVELKSIDSKILRNAKKLVNLNVSQNQLTAIPALLFFNAENLTRVDFSRNSIENVDRLAFMGANNLTSLNLSHNKINHLDSEIFSTSKLLDLDLSNNNLTALEEHVFDNITELKHLRLSFNPIGNLKIETFTYLTNLETLDLKKTNISDIELGTFSHQHKLTALDLSQNNLKKLDFNHFLPVLPDLRTLNLDGNQLTDLTGFGNDLFPKLEELDIRDNSFNCSYLEVFMKSVNWDKLRLPIDNPSVKAGETSIRGIKCEKVVRNETNDIKQENSTQQKIEVDEKSAIAIISMIKRTISDEIFITNIYLAFICLILLVFFIVYIVANLEQICTRRGSVTFQHDKTDKPSSAKQTVEFTNHSEVLLMKDR